MSLELAPVTRDEARAFIRAHHRHNERPPAAEVLRVAATQDGTVVAVALAGRPLAQGLCRPGVLEVTRVASAGAPNACSMLYGALRRAAQALGYRTLYTYTRADEDGASLKAAGWVIDAQLAPRIGAHRSWAHSRPRTTPHDETARTRWRIDLRR